MRTAVAKDKAKDKNVVHARLKRMGLRFELSLNRDKVPSKKDIAAKDFDPNWNEILFAQLIFSNAAKNEVAEKADIQKAFPDTKETDIFRLILEKGEILASLEERNESNADDKTLIARLAAHVASTSHVRPSSDELADTKKKHRLARYTAADIERELKNIKYKTGNASFPDQALDVISAIHTCGTLSIVRDMRVVVLEVEKPQMEESKRAIASLFRPCDHRVLNATADTITVLFDYAIEVAKVARSVEVLVPATIRNSEEFYIPKGDADDLTSLSPLSGKAEEAPAAKTGKKDAKPAAKTATASKGDAPAGGAASGLSALEAELKALQADDSDDDNRKGKGGKGKGKGGKAPPAPKPAAKATAKPQGNNGRKGRSEFSDSDEEES